MSYTFFISHYTFAQALLTLPLNRSKASISQYPHDIIRPLWLRCLSKWRSGLAKTSRTALGGLLPSWAPRKSTGNLGRTGNAAHPGGSRDRDHDRDPGVPAQHRVRTEGLTRSEELWDSLRRPNSVQGWTTPPALDGTDKPSVIMVVGVNGSGKTTTIAKLDNGFSRKANAALRRGGYLPRRGGGPASGLG
jgi:hypothetical protein